IDNLPRGAAFNSAEVDAFVTSDAYYDRELGYNDGRRVGGPNRCLLLVTGNNLRPSGDTADRTLVVNLRSQDPNPRARPASSFRPPDVEGYAIAHRAALLGAALTIWRAWICAGEPQPPGPDWGSFLTWVGTAVAVVRWLGLADPLADRESLAAA